MYKSISKPTRKSRLTSPPAVVFLHRFPLAACITEYGYNLNINADKICASCAYKTNIVNNKFYSFFTNHKLVIGRKKPAATCLCCDKSLAVVRTTDECALCNIHFPEFLEYLRTEKHLTLEELNDPTIITIDEDQGPIDLITSKRLSAFNMSLHATKSLSTTRTEATQIVQARPSLSSRYLPF